MPILTTQKKKRRERKSTIWISCTSKGNAALRCSALKFSRSRQQFSKLSKNWHLKQIFFQSTADSYAGVGSKICLDQQLYFKAAHLSTAFDFEVHVVQMPVLLKEPMNQLHFNFCLLKQLWFFSYIMVMCVVSSMASINKNIKLTEKLFIASFGTKELVNIILLH